MKYEHDVEKRLQAVVARDRVRIKEFFLDFDKLRKGWVGEAAFRTAVGTLNLRLSEAEVNSLLDKYRLPSGLIDYASFCQSVDTVFSDAADPKAAIQNAKSTAAFSEEEAQTVADLLAAVRAEIKTQRILIKPQFQGYDRTRSGHVTAEQFRRVLKELRLIPPTEPLFQLLARKYFDNTNVREVNYVAFCADIDKIEDIKPPYVAKHPTGPETQLHGQLRNAGSNYYADSTVNMDVVNNRFMQKRVEKSNNPNDVEDRIRAAVVMKRIRIEEFFHDFDKLRKGKIFKGQFEQVLSMLNFNLTAEEYATLCTRYRSNDPETLINYKAFCASINGAFTTYGIQ